MVSQLTTACPSESLRSFRTIILEPALLLLVMIAVSDGPQTARSYAVAIAATGAMAAVVGLVQYGTNQNIITAEEDIRRIRAFYGSPNNLGLLLDRTLPMTLALLAASSTVPRRTGWLAALAISTVGIVLTLSIGAWIAVAFGIGVTALFLGRRWVVGTVIAGLCAVAVGAAAFGRSERFLGHLDLSSGTSFLRIQVWESSFAMIRDHPLSGVGLDCFLHYYRDLGYMLPAAWPEPSLSHPHNWLLDFWLSLGPLGLLLAVSLAVWLALSCIRIARSSPDRTAVVLAGGACGALGATLIHGSIDNSFFLPDLAVLFWVGFAIVRMLSSPGEQQADERASLLVSQPKV